MANENYSRSNSNSKKSQNYRKKNSYGKKKSQNSEEKQDFNASKDVDSYVGSTNDPKWYNRNSRLVMDASKIPFSNQLGATVELRNSNYASGLNSMYGAQSIPGIMALSMINVPGIAMQATDAANIATAGLFQYVRKNLSTVATYAPADVMMTVLAVDEVYSMYANIARLFGIINAYSAINLYLPNRLIAAGYGFAEEDIATFRASINDYRSRFNNLIFKASTLYLPTDFSVTARHAWLYSNYFVDANSAKAQIYIHRMHGHHYWDEETYETGTALPLRANLDTMDGLLSQFNDMIDRLRNSDSFLKIQADMRRAFERSSQWQLAYVDEAFMVLPRADEMVLSQIHNTTMLPRIGDGVFDTADFLISQDVDHNIITFFPSATVAATDPFSTVKKCGQINYLASDKILNFYKDNVTTDDICEATRNTVALAYDFATPTTRSIYINQCGVDLCLGADIYFEENSSISLDQVFGNLSELDMDGEAAAIAAYTAFDWAPIMLMQTSLGTAPESTLYNCCVDLENYTIIDNGTLARLHANILCSMWSIPEFGGFNA